MKIDARGLHFKDLNQKIKEADEVCITIENCIGQRYIGSGVRNKEITIEGIPGNALGAYLDHSSIYVYGNAQDATGDTMDEGSIFIHGSSGDATGYGMRGGKIFVKGDAGYRAGIHMKAYEEKVPTLIIGGKAGSFLGEYQAGGTIIVLGLEGTGEAPVGRFCGTGMHGGNIYLRCEHLPHDLPKQVVAKKAEEEDLKYISSDVQLFCRQFGILEEDVWGSSFYVLSADTKNPYKQLYTHN
ncbi:MAG: glutamate synthase [Cellulosilyticaceae bacterium]